MIISVPGNWENWQNLGEWYSKQVVKNANRETQDADNNFIDPGLNLKNTLHVLHSPQVLKFFFKILISKFFYLSNKQQKYKWKYTLI